MSMDIIRQAILKHRGGLQKATDSELMIIWNSLDEQMKEQYLQNIRERKGKNAVSDTTKRNLQNSP